MSKHPANHPVPYTPGDLGPDTVVGTNDTFSAQNFAGDGFLGTVGDAGGDMLGQARGGNDTLTDAANGDVQIFIGDSVGDMHDKAHGGNDTLTAGTDADISQLFGDTAGTMRDHSVGGNDVISGGDGAELNYFYGDANFMTDFSVGGNDRLTAGAATAASLLMGDAAEGFGHAKGGNDFLRSGAGTDLMSGDFGRSFDQAKGGNDVFSFGAGNGHDIIFDFGQASARGKAAVSSVDGFNHGVDVIEITWGATSFSELTFTQAFNAGTHTSVIAGSDPGSDITVHSDHALSAHDFVFHLELR